MQLCQNHERLEGRLTHMEEKIEKSLSHLEDKMSLVVIAVESHQAFHKGVDEARQQSLDIIRHSSVKWGSVVSWLTLAASMALSIMAILLRQ